MAEFRKCKRDAKLLLSPEWKEWRLASVDEVSDNLPKIKELGILNSWDTARLLNGCITGKYSAVKQYRPNVEDMLLIKTDVSRHPDGSFPKEMYFGVKSTKEGKGSGVRSPKGGKGSGVKSPKGGKGSGVKSTKDGGKDLRVTWTRQGGMAAILLSCEDKITEAICFVLQGIVDNEKVEGQRVEELRKLTEYLQENFRNRRTVLHYAVDQPLNKKHGEYVAQRLKDEFKGDKNLIKAADIYGRTALHFAAFHGNIEVCRILIEECHMSVDETDINKENSLHFALKGKQTNVFNYLCELPEVRRIIGSPDAQGRTALHKAAAQGSKEMITTLLSTIGKSKDKEFYISQQNLLGQSEGRLDEEEKIRLIFIRQPDLFGQTALLEAARTGHVEAVELLLERGSRPLHERNSDGSSALHYAAQLSRQNEAEKMARLLLERCESEQEKSLLLWGTAEEASPESSQIHNYLKTEKEKAAHQQLEELFSIAIDLGQDNIAWELVKRGANTADIKKRSCPYKKLRINKVLNQLREINNVAGRSGDQPAIFDTLGRKEFAEGLATLFLNPFVKSPVTVGIFGEWGMGKSSLMIQTEIILLKTAAQLSFPNLLDTEQFPECGQIGQSPKLRQTYEKINKAAKDLLPSSAPTSEDDPLVQFLDGDYQPKYHEVYKSLALRDRNEMFPTKDDDEATDSSSNLSSLRKIPSILTVRYNAWHYQNELEAWAGLAVEITKEIEKSMTRAQRVRCRCRYAWREHGSKIFLELLLPCLLALFLSVWVAWAVWKLLIKSKHKDLHSLKYGSVPVTVLVVVWTVVRQLLSVLKPISVQMMGYLQLQNHGTNLGYQNQVISDINFLREEIGEKPSWIWRFIAWLWRFVAWLWGFIPWLCCLYSETVKDTSIFRSPPPHKDNIRMIVFVDDLDRCQDKVILQVLSAVNLVLAACNINVVLGMDMNMMERVMKGEFPNNRNPKELAEKYMGKIVQLPLALPDPNQSELGNFLEEQLGPAFEGGFAPESAASKAPTKQSAGHDQSSAGYKKLYFKASIYKTFQFPHQLFLLFDTDHNRDSVCLDVHQNVAEVSQSCFSKHPRIFHQLRRSKSSLLGRIQGRRDTKGKLRNMSFNMQMIMPNYIMEERIALDYLRKRATGDQKLPREWKRFINYHRIAWHILNRRKQVKDTRGWQQQLVIWVFCCWQWKHQIDFIIQNWKKLVPVNRFSLNLEDIKDSLELNKPSLKGIVKHCYQKIWLPLHHKEEKEGEEEDRKEWGVDREQEPKKEENDEKLELEKEEWLSLIDTFTVCDVSMECVDFFQKFRLHCKMGNLSTPNVVQGNSYPTKE